MNDCVFCKIIKNEIPTSKVYEDENFIAILDISPANKGHVLIIPKKHTETFLDTDDETTAKMINIAKKVAKGVIRTTKCTGYNILINNYKIAGQMIPHLHLHIIPRTNDDDFSLEWTHKEYGNGEIEKIALEIKNNI